MSTIVTRSGKGSPLTNTEVDANFTNLNTGKAELSGATFSGEITANGGIALGDNDKATFGAGDDLQIYHDGSNSYIDEAGTGHLFVRSNGDGIYFRSSTDEEIAHFNVNGSVKLYHDNAEKLATTSTGIDVTGTATMDGLTVDNSGTLASFLAGDGVTQVLKITNDATYNCLLEGKTNGNLSFKTKANGAGEGIYFLDTNEKKRMFIEGTTGDISFYDDTGNAKFFWDASAEDLQIGGNLLNLSGVSSGTTGARLNANGGGMLRLASGGVDALYVVDGGNVGIGVTPTAFSSRKSLDIGLGGKLWGLTSATETGLGNNFYFDGAYKRLTTNSASRHIQDGNGHTFDVAVSGSADSAISWNSALTIVPTGAATFSSTDDARVYIKDTGDSSAILIRGDGANSSIGNDSNHPISFTTNGTARLTISNSGNISTHPPAGNHFVINEDGVDSDFRVESDGNANMLFVDGGNNKVGIGTSSPATHLQVEGASGGEFGLHRTSGSTTGLLGSITCGNKDIDSGMGGIDFTQDGATDSSRIGFFTQPTGGAKIERVRIDSSGNVNVGGVPAIARTNGGTAFGGASAPELSLKQNAGTYGQLVVMNGSGSGSNSPNISLAHKNSAGNYTYGATIALVATDTTAGSEDYDLNFKTQGSGAAATERMRIDSSGFTKHSNTGVYDTYSGADDSHQFISNNTGHSTLWINNTNASYDAGMLRTESVRGASSAFSFFVCTSGNLTDDEFKLRGDGNAFADGTWSGGGADYAEYFEWNDGNTNNEDRVGYSVSLVNNKIKIAESGETVIGVISGNPSVVGDDSWNSWKNKYLKDDFERYVWEDYTLTTWTTEDLIEKSYHSDRVPDDEVVPEDAVITTQDSAGNAYKRKQLNPNYDDSFGYQNRESRSEWDIVGLMGKLRIRAGQEVGVSWIKMRDISATVEEWLIK